MLRLVTQMETDKSEAVDLNQFDDDCESIVSSEAAAAAIKSFDESQQSGSSNQDPRHKIIIKSKVLVGGNLTNSAATPKGNKYI